MSAAIESGIQKLLAVPGYAGRKNDIIYLKCKLMQKPQSTVMFFGGDVQDYPENMLTHRDNHRYVKWNLEATATILTEAFSQSDIMVVRPSRMYLRTFSCYDNFVESNQTGAPQHSAQWGAKRHLLELVRNATKIANGSSEMSTLQGCSSDERGTNEDGARQASPLEDARHPLILIGFSKGCVVLNQLVHEIHWESQQTEMKEFIAQIKAMYWLDGGHAGGSNIWITQPAILKSLASTGIPLHVHVTPYQIEDEQRPWIRREEKIFTENLRKMNAAVTRVFQFQGEVPSVELHFKLLHHFYKVK